MRRTLAFALLLFPAFAGVAGAQTATLVRDINPGAYVPVPVLEAPQQLTPVAGGAVFFTFLNEDPYPPAGLWFTDGTAAGTRFLMTFCGDALSCSRAPQMAATLPGLAFFYAESDSDPRSHPRLWRTDGTLAGTFPLTPILSEFSYGNTDFAVAGNRILLSLCPGQSTQDCALWRSDGTVAGTAPFSEAAGSNFVAAGGQTYFLGGRDNQERGLWRTDGTNRGTRLVYALNPQNYAWSLTEAGSRLFFLGGPKSGQVWTSDGTAAGTRLVKTFFESDHEFIPRVTTYFKPVGNGKVVFVGLRETGTPNLWLSDGTPAGTVRLTDAPRGEARWTPREDQITTIATGKRIVFIAGSRLWSSGGTLATTRALDRCPGGCPEVPSESSLVAAGKRVVFVGKDAAHGAELWVSDGTGPGTRLLADLCPGPCDSSPAAFTSLGGLLWLRATTGNGGTPRLVRTDGTGPGTVVLAPLTVRSLELDLALSSNRVFFTGQDPQYGSQPWVTDGTRAGTRRITALPGRGGSSDPRDLTTFGGSLLFFADDGRETGLWRAEGQNAAFLPGGSAPTGTPPPMDLTVAGGVAYFFLPGSPGGMAELWRTDGTAPGTTRIAIFPGQTLSELHETGGRLLFFTSPSAALWASDGTAAGTVKLFDLPEGTVKVSDVAKVGSELYFAVETGTTTQVFRSDGTAAGTRPILDLACRGCAAPAYPQSYAWLDNFVYFTAWANGQGFSGPALWRTDGTAVGTVRVLPAPDRTGGLRVFFPENLFAFGGDLYFFASAAGNAANKVVFRGRDEASAVRLTTKAGSEPFMGPASPEWTPVGGALYFRAWDIEHGMELWKTDGTPEGTVLVKDLLPGLSSADPRGLTAAGNLLFFSARDAAHGRELWVTDGTAAGTRLVQDLFPGGLSSDPEQLELVAGRLYFTADDGAVGRELWSLPIQ